MRHIVHLGDCLDPVSGLASLPDGSVDHVITDPPYSARTHGGFARKGRNDRATPRDALSFEHLGEEQAMELARQFARVAMRWIIVFGDEWSLEAWRYGIEEAGADFIRTGAWIKTAPQPQMTGDRPGVGMELIAIAHAERTAGRTRWNGGGRPALWPGNAQDPRVAREHPTQKPLSLMEALIRDFTDPGETILDPFAGSGTTGVAAKRLGRGFIGWERDETYHAVAERRIRDAREQLEIGMRAHPKAKQEALL